jgi:hypothetical protein
LQKIVIFGSFFQFSSSTHVFRKDQKKILAVVQFCLCLRLQWNLTCSASTHPATRNVKLGSSLLTPSTEYSSFSHHVSDKRAFWLFFSIKGLSLLVFLLLRLLLCYLHPAFSSKGVKISCKLQCLNWKLASW